VLTEQFFEDQFFHNAARFGLLAVLFSVLLV
jgi:hypothetical protein